MIAFLVQLRSNFIFVSLFAFTRILQSKVETHICVLFICTSYYVNIFFDIIGVAVP